MKLSISQKSRRILIVTNYLCLILLMILFHIGASNKFNIPMIAGIAILFVIALITFVYAHIRTHLWKLVHSKTEKLDEREIQITRESLQHSYSVFAIISLLFIMYLVLANPENYPVLSLIFGGLLYLAHTLPSSILAWREKEV